MALRGSRSAVCSGKSSNLFSPTAASCTDVKNSGDLPRPGMQCSPNQIWGRKKAAECESEDLVLQIEPPMFLIILENGKTLWEWHCRTSGKYRTAGKK